MTNITLPPSLGVADQCTSYRNQSPTASYLFNNAPPEYFPLLGIGLLFFLICSTVFTIEAKKHAKYFNDVSFKLAARVITILAAFWLFAFTNLLAMIFVRGDIFLHFVSNVFESACLLAFYDLILLHCRALGEVFDGSGSINVRVPPCCCCLVCLPEMKTTKKNLSWLRFAIIQQMAGQMLVEFIRVLAVFDCTFDPEAVHVVVLDVVVLLSFFFAMWAVFVVVKGRSGKLERFRYMQKFAMFKLMILVQKLFYKILALVADEGHISSYRGLNAKLRVAIWVSCITVVVSTLLLIVIRSFFVVEEYEVLKKGSSDEEEIAGTEYGAINQGYENKEEN